LSFLLVAAGYPLVLLLLSLGFGLLIERFSGWEIPTPLVPAIGFGGLVVVSQYTVLPAFLAPLTPIILAVIAVAGFYFCRGAIRRRWQRRTWSSYLPFVVGLLAYAVGTAPLWTSFRLTFPGYLLDTTNGFHLAGAEWILHHGEHFTNHTHSYGRMLLNYFQGGHPTGGNVLMAASGWLTGQDLLWQIEPFQAFAMAMVAMSAYFMARRAQLPPLAAALSGFIAGIPALAYSYLLMGSIKELSTMPEIFALGGLMLLPREQVKPGIRGVIPLAVVTGAGVGTLGPSFAPWVIALVGGTILFALPPLRERLKAQQGRLSTARLKFAPAYGKTLVVSLVLVAIGGVIAAAPTLANFANSLKLALGLSGSDAVLANDPGNLLRPLRFVQMFGVWLGYDHRVDPRYSYQTYLLIGVVIVAVVLGALYLLRKRLWNLAAFIALEFAVYVVLWIRGTEWTDGKVLMMLSPAIVLLGMIGAFSLLDLGRERWRGRRWPVEGVLLALVVAGSVLASDALAFHATNLAPTQRFQDEEQIEARFSGQGPTLLTDFDEYALYEMRHMDVDSPGYAGLMRRNYVMVGSQPVPSYGRSYDIDNITDSSLAPFKLIVQRRSPRWSRPPGNFKLVYQDEFYDVWRRTGPAPMKHVPLGDGYQQPVGAIQCKAAKSLAAQAKRGHAQLRYASRSPNAYANLATAALSPLASLTEDAELEPQISTNGPATITTSITVPTAGRYQLWLGGLVGRPVSATIDGKAAGSVSYQTAGDGNTMYVDTVSLKAGPHTVVLTQSGGGIEAGNRIVASIDGVYLTRQDNVNEKVKTIAPSQWKTLCGRQDLDWVEIT
jgi:hypothetical protein